MNAINFHHSTENRTSVDGSHIVGLLGKVIETHITNNETCGAASDALLKLLLEPSMLGQFNSISHFISHRQTLQSRPCNCQKNNENGERSNEQKKMIKHNLFHKN